MEFQKLIKDKKAIVGTDRTLREAAKGNVKKALVSKNCPKEVRDKLTAYNVTLEETDLTNYELGDACKLPYEVTVIGILNGTDSK